MLSGNKSIQFRSCLRIHYQQLSFSLHLFHIHIFAKSTYLHSICKVLKNEDKLYLQYWTHLCDSTTWADVHVLFVQEICSGRNFYSLAVNQFVHIGSNKVHFLECAMHIKSYNIASSLFKSHHWCAASKLIYCQ